MSLHDDYLRITPFEIAFPDADVVFAPIREESVARGLDPRDPHEFTLLGSVGSVLTELRDPAGGPAGSAELGTLLYHGYNLHGGGARPHLLSVAAARHAVDGRFTASEWELPHGAGYLQLPQHMFWMGSEGGDAAESVDGMFWTEEPLRKILHVLLVLGIRGDREGFTVVPVPGAPLRESGRWLEEEARDEGPDFAATLPGSELAGLHSIATAGEVLKLLARVFSAMAGGSLGVGERVPGGEPAPGQPIPSAAKWCRIEAPHAP
ncbi:MAG: hypothetical protein OEZ65_09995 [Gemmatimonadota bacterium]|nr:hypothetical protein [Gemmatimonadota bacterium]MDH5759909.1 hypothetical protein [Gemmatimonadota bacterium]